MAQKLIVPDLIQRPLRGVEVHLFGRRAGDMSLKNNPEVPELLSQYAASIDVNKIFAPVTTDFNALMCASSDLKVRLPTTAVSIMRGVNADGTEAFPGDAIYIPPADCMTIVAAAKYLPWIDGAHAGRECLLDKKHVVEGAPKRKFESIVDAIMAGFLNIDPSEISVWLSLGVGPESFIHKFDHPTYGDTNRKMVAAFQRRLPGYVIHDEKTGALDIPKIIQGQFEQYGVRDVRWDGHNTATETNPDGSFRWFSCSRGGPERLMRNGVLVVNRRR